MSEKDYVRGKRTAYRSIMLSCMRELEPGAVLRERMAAERDEAIAILRNLCKTHGDNDWSKDLHLADIIDKHLGKHLERQDDGYSIEVKDLAWQLFKQYPTETLKPGDNGWKTVSSFEDLSQAAQDYYLGWAKAKIEAAIQAEGYEGVQRLMREVTDES